MQILHGFMFFVQQCHEFFRFTLTNDAPPKIVLPDSMGMPPHGFFIVQVEDWGTYVCVGITWARAQGMQTYQCNQITPNVFHCQNKKLVIVLPEKCPCPMPIVAPDDKAEDVTTSFFWFPNRAVQVERVSVLNSQVVFKSATAPATPPHGFAEQVVLDDTTFWIIQFHFKAEEHNACVSVFQKCECDAGDIYVPVRSESVVNMLRERAGCTSKAKSKLQRYTPYHMPSVLMVAE